MDHPNHPGLERYEGAIWSILRAAYLRALLGPDRAQRATIADQNAALDAYFREMEHDLYQVMSVIARAQGDQLSRVRAELHAAPGIDHEMIDQAIHHSEDQE